MKKVTDSGLTDTTSYAPCNQFQPLSRIKTLPVHGQTVRGIIAVGEQNVYNGKDLSKSKVLSAE